MDIFAEMRRLHQLVWKFRKGMEKHSDWKRPLPVECLAFALTEVGEATDAYLRAVGGFARNHERVRAMEDELADTYLMLVSALGEGCYPPDEVWLHESHDTMLRLASLGAEVSCAFLYEAQAQTPAAQQHIWRSLGWLISWPEMEIGVVLWHKMESMWRKHVVPEYADEFILEMA